MSTIWDLDLHHARGRIGESTTVVDLGASVGDFAIPARDAGAAVLAVEPYYPNANMLVLCGIRTLHAAVGPCDGSCRIHVPPTVAERPTGSFAEYGVPGLCPMFGLSSIFDLVGREIDFVKCDVEGGEYEAFLGAIDSTLRRVRFAAIEFHVWTVEGQERLPGIGHRAGQAMRFTPAQLHKRLSRVFDVELEGNYEAGGTMFCNRREA